MHLDSGCHEHLKARSEGNPGWKRLPSVTCIPNKQQNPMMWPFDAPGKTWLHDSKDSSKDAGQWPYKSTDLRNFVESAPPSPAWADGIWYRARAFSPPSLPLHCHSHHPHSPFYFDGHPSWCSAPPALHPLQFPSLPLLAGTTRIRQLAACRRKTTATGTNLTARATPSGVTAPPRPRPRPRNAPRNPTRPSAT